jgi:hypothetical protein
MATYAVVYNGIVTNTIIAEQSALPESDIYGVQYIEYNYENPAVIGLKWDGETFEQPKNPLVSLSEIPPIEGV